jgi:hypothetical protein
MLYESTFDFASVLARELVRYPAQIHNEEGAHCDKEDIRHAISATGVSLSLSLSLSLSPPLPLSLLY